MSAPLSIDDGLAAGTRLRLGLAAVAAVLLLAAGWFGAFAAGLAPWLGYTWLTQSSFGVGPIGIIGEDSAGTSIGPDTFVFFAGQRIVIAYDADVRAGSLWLHVWQPFDGTLGDGPSRYVTASGAGEWSVPVTATGLYTITIAPSAARGSGRGYDLSYTAWWGARR